MKNWMACLCVLLLTLQSCKKDAGSGANSEGPFYYKATIGGTYYEAKSKANPTGPTDYWSGSGMGGQESVRFSSSVNPLTVPVPLGYTELECLKAFCTIIMMQPMLL